MITQILHGDARDQIEKLAISIKPELVILGARHASPLKKIMIGSTSEYLVRHLKFPVLVVH